MRQRQPGVLARRNRSRDARHDFEFDAMFAQERCLFGTSPKDKRVSAFQPHDGFPQQGLGDQAIVDFVLLENSAARSGRAARSFALSLRVAKQQQVYQTVVKNNVGFLKTLNTAQRDQPGISRSSSNEIDFAWMSHGCELKTDT